VRTLGDAHVESIRRGKRGSLRPVCQRYRLSPLLERGEVVRPSRGAAVRVAELVLSSSGA
jgi:hypothetical protein